MKKYVLDCLTVYFSRFNIYTRSFTNTFIKSASVIYILTANKAMRVH